MTEYFAIRIVLAAALLCLLLSCELPPNTRHYVVYMTGYQVLPQQLGSAMWWRTIWFALDAAQIVIGWFVCRELFRLLTVRRTHWLERQYVIAFASCIAFAFVLLSWRWAPTDSFQAWVSIRQYYRLAIFIGWLSISVWFGFIRPFKNKTKMEPLAALWLIWLASQFTMATAGASGILWRFVERSSLWYRVVGDAGMAVQIIAVLATTLILRRQQKYGT